MNSYKILSLDGGGIRGYLTVTLLERLEQVRPGFLDQFDLFAGTSIGSILALGLAYGLSPTELRELFDEQGEAIFADSLVDNILDLGFTRGAKYGNDNLKTALVGKFGGDRLQDLERQVLVPTFDLDNNAEIEDDRRWKAKFFHNFPGDDSDGCERIVNVALRSAAAPIFFPAYQGYVDGFIVANNPSMCAVAQVLSTKSAVLDEIAVLSIGTGLNNRYFPQQNANWGWRQWLFQMQPLQRRLYVMPLIYMMWEGSVDTANYQCKQLLGERFHRLDPVVTRPIEIDDVKRMADLRAIASTVDLADTLAWLDQHSEAVTA